MKPKVTLRAALSDPDEDDRDTIEKRLDKLEADFEWLCGKAAALDLLVRGIVAGWAERQSDPFKYLTEARRDALSSTPFGEGRAQQSLVEALRESLDGAEKRLRAALNETGRMPDSRPAIRNPRPLVQPARIWGLQG